MPCSFTVTFLKRVATQAPPTLPVPATPRSPFNPFPVTSFYAILIHCIDPFH